MHLVVATVTVRPDQREAAVAALNACAVRSREDDGCLSYGFYASTEDPNAFTSVEKWDGRPAVDAHMQTPHVQALLAALGDKVTGPPVIEVHEVAATTRV